MKQQRIVTLCKRIKNLDDYKMYTDNEVQSFNDAGWSVKQIVSTSFTHELLNDGKFPVLVISLLLEKE